ncbi:hypothetical protein [Microbulbifer sediminum]|uniref:hypothetical protein n=1 Tax=Microbulbifer sediminum TaxID=2904250 RepID=UPI001F22D95B|nr:hypothetical protein [Microbulbifer sediminum]
MLFNYCSLFACGPIGPLASGLPLTPATAPNGAHAYALDGVDASPDLAVKNSRLSCVPMRGSIVRDRKQDEVVRR